MTCDRDDHELMSFLGRYRHAVAALYVIATAGIAYLVVRHSIFALGEIREIAAPGARAGIFDEPHDTASVTSVMIYIAVELFLVLGVGRLTRTRQPGRSMLAAFLAISALAVLVLAGSVFLVGAELVDRIGGDESARNAGVLARDPGLPALVSVALFVLATWAVWWITIVAALRGGSAGRERALQRAIWTVLAGSWFNVLAALAVDAGIRRQEEEPCVCSQGTFWSLLFGIPLLLLSIGPAIVLIYRHHQANPGAARRTVWLKTRTRRR